MLRDDVADGAELPGGAAGFVEGSVVIVGGGVGLIDAAAVGSAHVSESAAAVSHIKVAGDAAREHPRQTVGAGLGCGGVVLLAPMVEPAIPILAAHARDVLAQSGEVRELTLEVAAVAEVDDGEHAIERATGEIGFAGAVGGIELAIEAGVLDHVAD